jgi:hypothetical protein
MASPPSFSISPGMPSGPIDLFLPIAVNRFLITLMLIVKSSPEWADCISEKVCSQLNAEA